MTHSAWSIYWIKDKGCTAELDSTRAVEQGEIKMVKYSGGFGLLIKCFNFFLKKSLKIENEHSFVETDCTIC